MTAARRVLGRTGLEVGTIGFGAGHCRDDAPIHYRALADALVGGIDLVHATNADAGRSELLVGTVLAHLARTPDVSVRPVLVTTLVEPWASRASLVEAVAASQRRLGRVDVVLLDAAGWGADAEPEVLRRAFGDLERLADAGGLQAYGLALTETSADVFDRVTRAAEVARAVAGIEARFGVLALPINVVEIEAAHARFADGATLLERAAELGLGVLAGRPLDVRLPGRSLRFVDTPSGMDDRFEAAREALARVRKLEAAWATGLGQRLVTQGGDDAVDLFRFGQALAERLDTLGTVASFRALRYDVLAPQLGRTSAALLRSLTGEAQREFASWWSEYGTVLHHAFTAIEDGLGRVPNPGAAAIERALDACVPTVWQGLPRARKAVLTVLASGVDAVLVGMRRPTYVRDMLALQDEAPGLAGSVDFGRLGAAMTTLRVGTGREAASGPDGP